MYAKPTGLTDLAARASGLLSRRDGAGRRKASVRRIAATLALTAWVAVVPLLAGAASGASAASTGITISTATGAFGKMLVVGSGKDDGYALYFITSDQPPHYGCSTTKLKVVGRPYQCAGPSNDQNVDWPPLTTKGAPVAGPGVSQKLLGTVQRAGIGSQVTHAGHPLYLFDQGPDAVTGEGWDEPSIPPDYGLWYPISAQGLPLPWADMLTTTPVDGKTVLGATMLNGAWHVFSPYSLSSDTAASSTCNGACAVTWPPLLTSGTPGLSNGPKASDFGTLKRSDGTLQVTYRGRPLYLYSRESAAPNANWLGFHVLGNGNGLKSPGGGTFNLVTP